jgi:hypothetical protein
MNEIKETIMGLVSEELKDNYIYPKKNLNGFFRACC